MCGTCGCKDAESFDAPFFEMDDLCVNCGSDEVTYESNLCLDCQAKLGRKKLGAESFDADWRFYKKCEIRCPSCGDGGGMKGFMKSLKEAWDDAGYDDYESIYCPMCGKGVELVIPQGYNEYGDFIGDDDYDAESFEAQRRITDYDWEGKPYTGKIYPDDPDFDADKADRNRDGKLSSWERALGNQVARGMREGGYSAESFDAEKFEYVIVQRPYHVARVRSDRTGIWDGRGIKPEESIHHQQNKKGKMYDEEVENWVPMNDEARRLFDELEFDTESFHSEGTGSRFPWKTLIAVAVGAFALTRIKNVEFKAHDCGCGCKGHGGCGDKKEAETFNAYPDEYDPVADFLPRYRYPADSVWSNDYNPADPYRPLDYQTVHTDSKTRAKRM